MASPLPTPMRFKAGKDVENKFVFPLSVVIAFVALLGVIPGALPHIGNAVASLWA